MAVKLSKKRWPDGGRSFKRPAKDEGDFCFFFFILFLNWIFVSFFSFFLIGFLFFFLFLFVKKKQKDKIEKEGSYLRFSKESETEESLQLLNNLIKALN